MRHVIVTRVTGGFVVLLLAAVLAFTWAARRPTAAPVLVAPAAPSGEVLFQRHCAACHDPADTAVGYRLADDHAAAAAELRGFLVDHYGPSPEGIALIVTHLLEPPPP
ncbi:MAG: hypothetical protein Q8L86_18475 [Vicinamibacterales bacterium]|nr:hypothetical protein [Vicinamibacterales bacterium]